MKGDGDTLLTKLSLWELLSYYSLYISASASGKRIRAPCPHCCGVSDYIAKLARRRVEAYAIMQLPHPLSGVSTLSTPPDRVDTVDTVGQRRTAKGRV